MKYSLRLLNGALCATGHTWFQPIARQCRKRDIILSPTRSLFPDFPGAFARQIAARDKDIKYRRDRFLSPRGANEKANEKYLGWNYRNKPA
ncbi:MAG: hypothetical protein HDQ93_00200 [Desulfovibrio sp.]|nr:hypothetical protein [Desulfovibrio sp.]